MTAMAATWFGLHCRMQVILQLLGAARNACQYDGLGQMTHCKVEGTALLHQALLELG